MIRGIPACADRGILADHNWTHIGRKAWHLGGLEDHDCGSIIPNLTPQAQSTLWKACGQRQFLRTLRVDENIRDFAKWPSVKKNIDKMLPDISAAWMRLGFKQTI